MVFAIFLIPKLYFYTRLDVVDEVALFGKRGISTSISLNISSMILAKYQGYGLRNTYAKFATFLDIFK